MKFQSDLPRSLLRVPELKEREPYNLSIAVDPSWKISKHRILVVIEHVDTQDLESGRLLSGPFSTSFSNAYKMAVDQVRNAGHELTVPAFAFINFNFVKTYDLSRETQDLCDTAAAERVNAFIEKAKPHKVLVIGDNAARALLPWIEDPEVYRGWPHKHPKTKMLWFSTVSLHKAYSKKQLDDGGEGDVDDAALDHANLLGYQSRNVASALHGDLLYKIEVKPRPVLIDTMRKWRKLHSALMRRKVWAFDTETDNLNRAVDNRLLLLQFAFDSKRGYVVPLYHKDSKFSRSDLASIEQDLYELFDSGPDPMDTEYDEYAIGHNIKFDMIVSRLNLKLFLFKRRVWDLMAGEFLLDENVKTLKKYGTPQYGLMQVCVNYGCDWYRRAEFSKAERATIGSVKLTKKVLNYAAMDVQAPFAIHEQQQLRAKHTRHTRSWTSRVLDMSYRKDYQRLMVTQLNNMINVHATMEGRGVAVDLEWLHYLRRNNGPLQSIVNETRSTLYKTKAVRKANERLVKLTGAPATSMYGSQYNAWMFKINKPEHKAMLFFDVLKLEPLTFGKSGPSIDKAFCKHYADVEEVKHYTSISEVDKLLSTYVKPWLFNFRTNPDFKATQRLFPSFGFVDVVSGRSNSYEPNFQNLPSRGKFAKTMKRTFATVFGRLKIKVDYNAHEVRMWAITSQDTILSKLFDFGRELRRKFRKTEDPKYLERMLTEGDVHVQNVSFFFSISMDKIKPVMDKIKNKLGLPSNIAAYRDAVKSIVFGAIYGRSARSIAGQVNKTKEFIEKLLKQFFKRFPRASSWLEAAKKMPLLHNFVVSLIGRRRHMYAHLFGIEQFESAVERRGANSPIQSVASDIGHTAAYLFGYHLERFCKKFGFKHVPMKWELEDGSVDLGNIELMVHDALEADSPYELYLSAIQILQWCATIGCMEYYAEHFGVKFTTPLEVEFELGSDSSTLIKWDWSDSSMKKIVRSALEEQAKRLPAVEVEACYKRVYSQTPSMKSYLDKHYPIMPKVTS